MTINNSHKPIGNAAGHDTGRRSGATFGERRQLGNHTAFGDNIQAHKQRDFFSSQRTEKTGAEVFSSNAQFLGGRKVVPHKIIEAGHAHAKPKITDSTRLAFLDRIIAASGENAPPQTVKPAIKQVVRAIAAKK